MRKSITYYELRKVSYALPEPGEFRLSTAACLDCRACGANINGMGGPGDCPICERCADVLRRGEARGCIVWEE